MSRRAAPADLMEDVETFLHQQATARDLSPHTLRAYTGDLVEMCTSLEEKGAVATGDVDLLALRRHLSSLQSRGLVVRSVARKISAIRTFFRWPAHEGRAQHHPASLL